VYRSLYQSHTSTSQQSHGDKRWQPQQQQQQHAHPSSSNRLFDAASKAQGE
jgi:hypothetical protein